MRGNPTPTSSEEAESSPPQDENITQPTSRPPAASLATPIRVYGGGARPSVNDGVFANLSAKPEHGEKTEEQPPVSLSTHHP